MLAQSSVWSCCQQGRHMLIVEDSVVCHSKLLIWVWLGKKKKVPWEFFDFLLFWMDYVANNFTQFCPVLGNIIFSSLLDAQPPPGPFHPPFLTSLVFETFFSMHWAPRVSALPVAAHWWNVQSCSRYKCLAWCSQLGVNCLWLSSAARQHSVIKYAQISFCSALVYVDQKYDN